MSLSSSLREKNGLPFWKNSQKIPVFFGTPPLDWLGKCVESGGPGDFRNFEVILMVLVYLVNLVVLMNLLILVILPGILNIWVVFFDLCECS